MKVRTTRWRRRTSLGLVAIGAASVLGGSVGMLTAHAADEPRSNFGSIDIAAAAYGLRVPFFTHSGEDVESELPYSLSQLSYGGHALTSVMWPGDTGGHGGDTFKLLTGSCLPPNPTNTVPIPVPVPLPDLPCAAQIPPLPNDVYESMNDPYKAEAQSGTGDPVDQQSHPGVEMTATATRPLVRATTTMAGGKLVALGDTFGRTGTDTKIKLTGPNTATVDAVSTMRDVSLGGGAITIDSIASVAHVVSNGTKATAKASTTVSGMKVGGVPVTFDDRGVHAQGQGRKLPSIGALNEMLKQSGFHVVAVGPTRTVDGPSAQVFSGQLILTQDNDQYASNLNDTKTVLTLGGATIRATTGLGYQFDAAVPPPVLPSTSPPPVAGTTGGDVGVPPSTGGGDLPPAPQVAGDTPPAQAPALASKQSPLFDGIPPGLVAAVLLGAGLVAAGLKRLPDEVLRGAGGACPLGEQT